MMRQSIIIAVYFLCMQINSEVRKLEIIYSDNNISELQTVVELMKMNAAPSHIPHLIDSLKRHVAMIEAANRGINREDDFDIVKGDHLRCQ